MVTVIASCVIKMIGFATFSRFSDKRLKYPSIFLGFKSDPSKDMSVLIGAQVKWDSKKLVHYLLKISLHL